MSLVAVCAWRPTSLGLDGLVIAGASCVFGTAAAVASKPLRASLPKFIKIVCNCCIIAKFPADSLAAKWNAWRDASSNILRVSVLLTTVVGAGAVPPWVMLHASNTGSDTHRGVGKARHT